MEKVILELVEFDRQAQKAVRAAEERSASERARIVQEKEALSARYRERAKQTDTEVGASEKTGSRIRAPEARSALWGFYETFVGKLPPAGEVLGGRDC